MESTENWRPVPGYEGLYEVSDQGRVRSLDRVITDNLGRPRRVAGRTLKPYKHWYWVVVLSAEPRPIRRAQVHHLVAEAFIGPRPAGLVVRHLNDDRDDNSRANLAYGTDRENSQDALRNGLNRLANRTHCPRGHEFAGDNLYLTREGHRKCRACRKEWASPRTGAASTRNSEACPKGHLRTPENLYVSPSGKRECNVCRVARNAKRKLRPLNTKEEYRADA